MTTQEAYRWLKGWYNERKASLQTMPALIAAIKADARTERVLRALYLQLFTKPLSGCSNCLADAFVQVVHYPEEKITAIMECKFKLKKNVVIWSTKLGAATNANLTDELAIALLRENNARVAMFEVVPDNLDELVTEKPAEPKKTANKTKSTKKSKK